MRECCVEACFTILLEGQDSSISGRMACKSSEAETTGNNKSKTQPNRIMAEIPPTRRMRFPGTDCRSHSQIAGMANVNQRRLSSNSIEAARADGRSLVTLPEKRC